MTETPIYIAADNIISSLGLTTSANIAAINNENTGVKRHDDTNIYPTPVWVSKVDNQNFTAALETIKNAEQYSRLEQLFLLSINDAAQQINLDLTSSKTLIIIASTKGNIDLLEHKNHGKFSDDRVLLGNLAKEIQTYYNNPHEPLVVCNACISGVLAMDVAKRLLRNNSYDNIVVTGGDLVSEFTVSGFQCFKAMSDAPCKPYDKNRVGINLGEGIGTVILTNQQPQDQEAIVLAGGASSNDANHISGPSRTGDGLFIAMDKALKDANCSSDQLDYLSMHGTATPYNDEMESKAIALAGLQEVPLNSMKGYIGHTLGAAGLIESIVAIHSLKNNMLYASLGFEELGVPKPINVIKSTTPKSLTTCLKTASGFGGCNAAMVFSKVALPQKTITATATPQITRSCDIKNEQILLDNQVVFEKAGVPFAKFIKAAYKEYELSYPKFHKMDRLCKLAFVAANLLLDQDQLTGYAPEDIAVVMANASSTLHTDSKHAESIKDHENYYPSPAVFVYTLPNIMVGEICIKYNIKGESCFFVSNTFDKDFLTSYSQDLIAKGNAKVAIMGWVDYTEAGYHASLHLIK